MQYRYVDLVIMCVGLLLVFFGGIIVIRTIGGIISLYGYKLAIDDGVLSDDSYSFPWENEEDQSGTSDKSALWEPEEDQSGTNNKPTVKTTSQSTSGSDFNANYGLVAFIGFLILTGGLMMPATKTVTSESCTEGVWFGDSRVGGGCVEAETEVPNNDRGVVMVVGMIVTLVGGIGAIAADSSDSESSSTTQQTVNQTETARNELGNQETQIRISAETKQSDSSETARSELTIETTDINEAKNEFLQHCNEQGLEVVSELRTEVIE